MRVRLKGINQITKKLADGTTRTYWYAWKGGPPLHGEPGTPEFIASYNEAVASKVAAATGQAAERAAGLSGERGFSRPRRAHASQTTSADQADRKGVRRLPIVGADRPAHARNLHGMARQLATISRRQADYAWTVLARVSVLGARSRPVAANPCERGGRLYRGSRAEKIWTAADEAAFLARAPAHLHLALLLALWTGQRQGDLLRLPWSAYDGKHIRLRQSKGGAPCR